MKRKELINLGLGTRELSDLAIAGVRSAAAAGFKKSAMRRLLRQLIADPGPFAEHQHFGELARQLARPEVARTAFTPRRDPAPYRRWGADIDDQAVRQMDNACSLPVSALGALMPDAHVGYGLPIGGVLATEGAVIPYAEDEWSHFISINMRWILRWATHRGIELKNPPVMVHLQSGVFTHASALLSRARPGAHCLPITLPRAEIVERLNELQPTSIAVYSSALRMFHEETRAGRLHIQPQLVIAGGEPLLEGDTERIHEIWDAGIFDVYGSSEIGMIASSEGDSRGLCLNEDIAIIELVDDESRPIEPGERASRLYVTPLLHRTLPLFRYEITDEVTLLDAPTRDGPPVRRIDHVAGRVDEIFDYGRGVIIHPIVFRSPLTKRPEISAYQVRQTPRGAEIRIVADSELDLASLECDIEAGLRGGGVPHPEVRIQHTDAIARTANGQKLRRFVPVGAR